MAKHIGIVGCSAEGAALCYRTICEESGRPMGGYHHPEVTMHTHSFGDYMHYIDRADWQEVAALMLSSAKKLQRCGARFAICPDNTIHQAFSLFIDSSPIPWLHIAEVVVKEAKKHQYKKLAVLGTRYLMDGPVYPEFCRSNRIACAFPSEVEKQEINRIIFSELIFGNFKESSRHYLNQVIEKLKGEGCDAAVLGCTELPLIVQPQHCPLPVLDSTRLLARAAISYALANE